MSLYTAPGQKQLTDLPVELLVEVYLFALEPTFALVCKHIYHAAKSFPPSIHAQYLLSRHPNTDPQSAAENNPSASQLTHVLRYPICTLPVLKALCRISSRPCPTNSSASNNTNKNIIRRLFELPRRIFRSLGDVNGHTGPDSDPLPLLRFVWDKELHIPRPNPNSNNGYPLVRAVNARFIPLIQYLLDRGADPGQRECMAVRVAVWKHDLQLVKMLIELPPETGGGRAKRRKRVDRVAVEPFMLNWAVKCDARDIVQYFMQEKGCIPDMKTLKAC